jgi:hypothetical protein
VDRHRAGRPPDDRRVQRRLPGSLCERRTRKPQPDEHPARRGRAPLRIGRRSQNHATAPAELR